MLLVIEDCDSGDVVEGKDADHCQILRSTKWLRIAVVAVLAVALLACIGSLDGRQWTTQETVAGAPLTLELADQMLVKDIDFHRATFDEFKRGRVLSTAGAEPQASLDDAASFTKDAQTLEPSEMKTKWGTPAWSEDTAGMKSAVAGAVGRSIFAAINGDSAEDPGLATYQAAQDLITSALAVSCPILSIAVVTAMSLFEGVFFPGNNNQPSETEQLYTTIMGEVNDLIKQNNIETQMASAKDSVLALVGEMAWIPELVHVASDDVKMSAYIAMQTHLAMHARTAFGDCFDSLTADGCKAWQQAGTIEIGVDYAQLHLQIFADMHALTSATDDFKDLLKLKMEAVAVKYRCLLQNSYSTYLQLRLNQIVIAKESSGGSYNWEVKVVDKFTSNTVRPNFYKPSKYDSMFKSSSKKSSSKAKKRAEKNVQPIVDLKRTNLEAKYKKMYEDPINALTDWLDVADDEVCAQALFTSTA